MEYIIIKKQKSISNIFILCEEKNQLIHTNRSNNVAINFADVDELFGKGMKLPLLEDFKF